MLVPPENGYFDRMAEDLYASAFEQAASSCTILVNRRSATRDIP